MKRSTYLNTCSGSYDEPPGGRMRLLSPQECAEVSWPVRSSLLTCTPDSNYRDSNQPGILVPSYFIAFLSTSPLTSSNSLVWQLPISQVTFLIFLHFAPTPFPLPPFVPLHTSHFLVRISFFICFHPFSLLLYLYPHHKVICYCNNLNLAPPHIIP